MPQVQLTWKTKLLLHGLRLYLIVMMVLIVIKFIRVYTAGTMPPAGHP